MADVHTEKGGNTFWAFKLFTGLQGLGSVVINLENMCKWGVKEPLWTIVVICTPRYIFSGPMWKLNTWGFCLSGPHLLQFSTSAHGCHIFIGPFCNLSLFPTDWSIFWMTWCGGAYTDSPVIVKYGPDNPGDLGSNLSSAIHLLSKLEQVAWYLS